MPQKYAKDAIGSDLSCEERIKLFQSQPALCRQPQKEYFVTKATQVFPDSTPEQVMDFFCSQKCDLLFQPGFVTSKKSVYPEKTTYGEVGDRWYVEWATKHWGIEEIQEFDRERHFHSYLYGYASDPDHSMVSYLYESFQYTQQGKDTLVLWTVNWVPKVNKLLRFIVQPLVSRQSFSNISTALKHRADHFKEYLQER